MVDGVHFGDHLCVVALGIGIDGTKVPLALVEGSTENTTTVTDLLVGMRERGLDTSKPILVGIDGAKALAAAVKRVFDHPVIQRCQLHQQRNVTDRLPDDLAPWSANGCAPPTTPTPRWPLRPSSKPSPASSSEPTRARPGRCGKGWRRRSPCCG